MKDNNGSIVSSKSGNVGLPPAVRVDIYPIMRQVLHRLTIETNGMGLTDISRPISDWAAAQGMKTGLLTIWCRHTSASLTVQENAAPAVRRDITRFFETLVPEGKGLYAHDDEGPDDMPAHLRAMLTDTQLSIPMADGRLTLGTWQGIYLFEHRRHPHRREIVCTCLESDLLGATFNVSVWPSDNLVSHVNGSRS